ncbi:unnamed protein product [Diplocarpon coronariae]
MAQRPASTVPTGPPTTPTQEQMKDEADLWSAISHDPTGQPRRRADRIEASARYSLLARYSHPRRKRAAMDPTLKRTGKCKLAPIPDARSSDIWGPGILSPPTSNWQANGPVCDPGGTCGSRPCLLTVVTGDSLRSSLAACYSTG